MKKQYTKGKTFQNERCASVVSIGSSISRECLCTMIASMFSSLSDMNKSIDNLPLFLFDVKTAEVSFHCTRRSHPPKNQRVFLAAKPRSESQPRASCQRPENVKKNRLVKTRFTWEAQLKCNQDSFAGLTSIETMRPDTVKRKSSETSRNPLNRLNCTVTGGSMVK